MTTTVCDFAILTDGRFDLATPQDVHRETFDRPPGFVPGTNLAQPVLYFKVKPRGSTRFTVSVGESRQAFDIGTGDNDDEQLRTLHWIIPGSEFSQPQTPIEFRVTQGRATFAELVLTYQVSIDANPT